MAVRVGAESIVLGSLLCTLSGAVWCVGGYRGLARGVAVRVCRRKLADAW